MKWVKRIVVLLVVVVVVVGVIGYVAIDKITKAGIEQGGTYAMGVETKLDGIHLGLLSGSVSMDGLSVANPEGFKSDHFLSLGDGSVEVSLGSLMGDKVEIPRLALNDIDMALEKDGGKANYQVILDNLAKLSSGEAPPAEETEGKRFVINELVITEVNVKAEVIGGVSVPIYIPEIRLTDIGSDSDKGVLMKDLAGIIVTAIMATVVQQAGDVLPAGIGEGLQGGLAAVGDLGDFGMQVIGDVSTQAGEIAGQAAEQLGEGVEQAGEAAQQVGEEVNEAVDKLGEGLGGLFGSDKDEAPKSQE